MASVFTRILNNELPSYRVFENELVFAILALDAIQLGHTLVIPKLEVDTFYNLPEPQYSEVFKVAKILAPAIKKATGCLKVGAAFVGLEVAHVHLHLLPLFEVGDTDFKKGRPRSKEEMSQMQAAILAALG